MADIHLGVKLPKIDYLNSLNMFLDIIKHHKEECHAIFVCGDMFDHRLSVDDLIFASYFLTNLACNSCGRGVYEHVPVYFIHGTYTHDQDQYEIFADILEKLPNVHVYYTKQAATCNVLDGSAKVLFLPQEYGDISYEKYFNDTYDIIIGHGPVSSQNKSPCKSAKYEILHSAELLGKISKICVFGHYHCYTDFGNNVFYTGPWLRWQFGEYEDTNKFFFCNDKFEVETVENPYAMDYTTIQIHNPEELREYLCGEIKNPHRFMIQSSPDDMETYRGIINSNHSSKVRFVLEEIVDDDDLQLSVDETINAQVEAVQPMPALISYIKDKYGVDAEDQIKEYESQINKEGNKE